MFAPNSTHDAMEPARLNEREKKLRFEASSRSPSLRAMYSVPKDPAQKAINFLCAAQKDNPKGTGKWGWRYLTPQDIQDHRSDYADEKSFKAELVDADTSVTGRMDENELDHFNKDGGSVEMIGAEHSPSMEVTTGSLAQGLSMAAGVAWARKRRQEPGKVWVYMSDGEFQEGQTWECLAAIAYHGIDNLRVIVDVNRQQCDGAMSSVLDLGDLAARVSSFGVTCRSVDGHDLDALRDAANSAEAGKPLVILANTSPFQGMNFLKKRFPRLHYVRFKSAEERLEMQAALAAELGIDPAQIEGA